MAGSASASASGTDTNADENMRLAIARFRRRMAAANQKFFEDRVDEIDAKGLATEDEKRDKLRQYRGMGNLEWDNQEPKACRRRDGIQMLQQTLFRDLDIPTVLNSLPSHKPADGVLPPLLHTEQLRQIYLSTVQRVCQRQADTIVDEDSAELYIECDYQGNQRPITIPQCDELSLFLKYAQGVIDVDFRLSGIAPFTPAWSAGITAGELDGLDEVQRRNKLADPELLKREQEHVQQIFEDELSNGWLDAYLDEDLEVRARFLTGIGFNQRYACPASYSVYVYCRLRTDDDKDDSKQEDRDVQDAANIRDWGWRVVFVSAEGDNPLVLYGRRARFDSIPDFLDWYASWPDYLDARGLLSLRRRAIGCETDCESDCEDHGC